MPSFISKILRFALKLLLLTFGLVFALSLLAAAMVVMLISLVKALISGKKPTASMGFGGFQKFSAKAVWPRAASAAGKPGEVVDVEVREIHEVREVQGDKLRP